MTGLSTILVSGWLAASKATAEEVGSVLMSPFASVAVILAAILAGITLLGVYRNYVNGASADAKDILRPVLMLFIVMAFNTVVYRPVAGLTNFITGSIANGIGDGSNFDSVKERCNAVMADADRNFLFSLDTLAGNEAGTVANEVGDIQQKHEDWKATNGDASLLSKSYQYVKSDFMKGFIKAKAMLSALSQPGKAVKSLYTEAMSNIQGGLLKALGGLMFLILSIVFDFVIVYGFVHIIVLTAIGPLVFAFAVIPNWKNGIASWIEMYFETSMWIPVAYLVKSIFCKLACGYLDALSGGVFTGGMFWHVLAVYTVGIASIGNVPKFANWIIHATGLDGAISSAVGKAGGILSKLPGVK